MEKLENPTIRSQDRDFLTWIRKKDELHATNRTPYIKEGEIWWAALGENIGVEINGKNDIFSRPVLIFRKLNSRSFMAIPLTTQAHIGSWYVHFKYRKRREYAVLAQARTISVARLYTKIGQLSAKDFTKVKEGFHALYCS